VASLVAAYMSTIGTHLNWGASYVVNDFYKRFINPKASEKELVRMGRLLTVLLMIFAAIVALWLENAKQAFDILLQIGAGTGLIFILRWFWWRINAFTEISAMTISFVVAVFFKMIVPAPQAGITTLWYQEAHWQLLIGIAITTTTWLLVTYMTRPENDDTLKGFVKLTRPGGPGWKRINEKLRADGFPAIGHQLPLEILCMFIGIITVYAALFATGFWLYDQVFPAVVATTIAGIAAISLLRIFGKLKVS
jgi:Na+/proline symporter